ncbi:hypothetical protein MESS4_680022 [Mesorhizobium sp. STM 4661]|nr:hypothetical protein MESS4_680022 [Mesorhizobium sp. STM 4661]
MIAGLIDCECTNHVGGATHESQCTYSVDFHHFPCTRHHRHSRRSWRSCVHSFGRGVDCPHRLHCACRRLLDARRLMHVAQKHALGLDPWVRSGFGTTTCMKQKLEAHRMSLFRHDALQALQSQATRSARPKAGRF